MLRTAAFSALFVLLSGSAVLAQPTPPPAALPPAANTSLDPTAAPSGTYTLDHRHSSVTWRVRHLGIGLFTARIDKVQGALEYDGANLANSSVSITADANSVSTNVLTSSGEQRFNGQIANVLGAEDHPLITFASRTVTRTGPATGLIEGDLTLNGQTHPVVFETTFVGGAPPRPGQYGLGFIARTIIDRSQWGVRSDLFDRFAANEVEIIANAEFVKE